MSKTQAISPEALSVLRRMQQEEVDSHAIYSRIARMVPDQNRKVLERIHAAMKSGGLLYVGHSENFTESRDLFRLRGKTIYERV